MEKTVFHYPEKQFLLGAMKFFFKNWPPHSFNNAPLTKNIEQMNTISPRQKMVLQLLFLLVETIIEIRKDPIFKK